MRTFVRNLQAATIGAALSLLWLGQTPLSAQSVNGVISGVITDPNHAIVRGASVEMSNENTGLKRSVTTDDQGFYRFLNVEPGVYALTAQSAGFSPHEQRNVTLLAREEVRLDLELALAAARTVVEVTEVAPVISQQLTQSDSKSGEVINALALNFRATSNPSPIVVATLAPGVNSDSGGNITISGQLPTATSFSLDGISTQLPRYGGPTRDLFPSVENIAEFRVNASGNSAEFSQPTDITVVTKSGTNDFHGAGYWNFQRKDFNSTDKISGIVPSGDADNFGAVLGGPLSLGKLYSGKNRTFFYFDYEGVRLDTNTLISATTPPAAWRNGDFSGAGSVINDLNGNPIPGNKITNINPTAAALIPFLFPNPTTSATNTNAPNLVQSFPGSYTSDGFDGRLDHNISENHRIWGRVTQKNISVIGTDGALGAGGAGDTTYNPLMGPFSTTSDLTNISIDYSALLRPTLNNELRFGYSRANFDFSYPQALQGDSIVKTAGILGLPGSPKNGLGGTPVFYLGDFLGGQTNPYGHPRLNKNTTFEINDSVSWIRGPHTIKFGGRFRRVSYQDNITFNLGDEYGDYFYNGNDAQAFATFLQGGIDDAVQAQNGPDGKPYGYHYSGFAQDEWRVRRNFTVTLGLRYEINTPFNDATDQLGNFDRNYPGGRLVIQNNEAPLINPLWKQAVGSTPFVTASAVGLPNTLRYLYKTNIQPRLGLAWSPGSSEHTAIRASVGRYSVPVLGAVLYSLLGVDTSYYADYGSTRFPNAFPTGAGSAAAYPGYRRANQYNLQDPTVWQWNFAIDQEIGWKTVARASYTGSHTYNLIYSPDLNQVAPNTVGYAALVATPALRQKNLRFPNFREVLTRDNGPSAKYDALTLELNRRFANDLSFNNNYTWAKNVTNALGAAPSSAIPTGGQGDNGENVNNYYNIAADSGNAYFNPRHRFVSTLVYDLPVGRGKKFAGNVSRAANLVVGGWRVAGSTILQTGPWLTPYFPSSLADPSGTAPSDRSVKQQRPDCLASQSGYLSNPTTGQYFNPAAFTIPGSNIGRFGNCGVGILEGPGTHTFSMSVGKNFALTERIGLRYEAQFANLFNLLNKDVPNMNLSSSCNAKTGICTAGGTGSFGQISQSQQGTQSGPRTIQMTLRLQF